MSLAKIEKLLGVIEEKRITDLNMGKEVEEVDEGPEVIVQDSQAQPQVVQQKQVHFKGRNTLTPHQYWLAYGKGSERPYTGELYFTDEVGHYECGICKSHLFNSDQKYFPETGITSFWNHVEGAVEVFNDAGEVIEDLTNVLQIRYSRTKATKQRVACKTCKSHLGILYNDGPPPTFLRYSVNSAILKFVPKPWFEDPTVAKAKKKLIRLQKVYLNKDKLREDVVSFEEKLRYDKDKYEAILGAKREEKTAQHGEEAKK